MSARVWAAAGSVVSAAASSACCWLPLLMLATGFSAAGAGALLERFRVPFLVAAGVLLVLGFYLEYRPASRGCGPCARCEAPRPRLRRLNRGMLWLSAALVVAFALFPGFAGSLAGTPQTSDDVSEAGGRLVLSIRGMTCTGCEAGVEAALSTLPGVRQVTASFEEARAVIDVDPGGAPAHVALVAAVGKAGYELTSVTSAGPGGATPPVAGEWAADVSLEDQTVRLVLDLGRLGDRWVGEFDLIGYVDDYPVEVAVSGDSVTAYFTAMGMRFEGVLSDDGRALIGTGTRGEEKTAIALRREATEPRFSEQLLQIEAAADDPSLVGKLSPDAAALRERFNADREKTRLLMLLSPT